MGEITLSKAMTAFNAGKKHWRDVEDGKLYPKWPRGYRQNKLLRYFFAKGAVEEMNSPTKPKP